MSNYFRYFPTTPHDLKGDGRQVLLTNIMRRFKVNSEVKNVAGTYHSYEIQAGDRPDTIAHKYYGNSKWDWVVLHYNEIQHPTFGWPMFEPMFTDYVKNKYGSIAKAQQDVYEYRWIYQQKDVSFDGIVTEEKYYVVDEETYNTLQPSERTFLTNYDWEVEKNEKKRSIRLLDVTYLPQLESEVKNIIKNGL